MSSFHKRREALKREQRGQRYASAGIECCVDRWTGRMIAHAVQMALVTVPVEDAKSRIMDTYYCERHQNPFSVPTR